MIDTTLHDDLGSALAAAFDRWPDETAHVESDRDREVERLTYAELGRRRLAFAAFLDREGLEVSDRVAIAMTNRSAWHVAAAGAFHVGATLVPIDWKLSGEEHLALLAHARPRALVVESHLWGAMARADGFAALDVPVVVVLDAPPGGEPPVPPGGASRVVRWESNPSLASSSADPGGAAPVRRPRGRDDVACVVYSSGTGGRPKGCLLTHGNYLDQYRALSTLHPFRPGVRYLSILPTNHAIDFMVGFLGPYLCGATVVHLRTLRPEFVRAAFPRYGITHLALVPMILKNLETGLRARFDELPAGKRRVLDALIALNRLLSRGRPNPRIARRLLPAVHDAFGGRLEAMFVGGASTDPGTLRFFHDLGIRVANGYGLTEAGTALTLDRLDPPRPDSVGEPLPGVELRLDSPGADGIGEVCARGPMVMKGYLDDPELTAETIRDGWLHTGDLGRMEGGALRLFGRRKNMIVTAGGKNVYPEDVEAAFAGLEGVEECCIFAAHYLWPDRAGRDERLVLVARLRPEGPGAVAPKTDAARLVAEVATRNRRLLDFKRVGGVLIHAAEFPRTASMKIKRDRLAEDVARAADSASALVDVS